MPGSPKQEDSSEGSDKESAALPHSLAVQIAFCYAFNVLVIFGSFLFIYFIRFVFSTY